MPPDHRNPSSTTHLFQANHDASYRHNRYFFASTGWLDNDWAWHDSYNRVAKCGQPKDDVVGIPTPHVYTRAYEHCSAILNCTSTAKDGCHASIQWMLD